MDEVQPDHDRAHVRRVLSLPGAYRWMQNVVAGREPFRYLVDGYVKPRPGDDILDIGCGPARILESLPGVSYVGFDPSSRYVDAAQRRHGARGKFFVADVLTAAEELGSRTFDIVLAVGVVHHVDDATAVALFSLARSVLRPGGRLVTLDSCFSPDQSRFARWMVSLDRGRYVRDSSQYQALAATAFSSVTVDERHDATRFPFTLTVLTCE